MRSLILALLLCSPCLGQVFELAPGETLIAIDGVPVNSVCADGVCVVRGPCEVQSQFMAKPRSAVKAVFASPMLMGDTEAEANDRELRRRVVIGITLAKVPLADKLTILRGLRTDEGWSQARGLITTAAEASGMQIGGPEWDWQEFYDFMKWLIPLLLQMFITV